VSIVDVKFQETTAQTRTESLPLAHLSIELGHLYAEDFRPGYDSLVRYFEQVAPWVEQARETCRRRLPAKVKPRISTCYLVDDYLNEVPHPAEVITQLRAAAAANGIEIDYLARESGCVEADGVPLARLVVDHLVPDPPQQTTGARPSAATSGWLCNGQRSPEQIGPAMRARTGWTPPHENSANPHSIFVDVQLWSDEPDRRVWSCAFLAAVWQLGRLGVLRHRGAAVIRPQMFDPAETLPADWTKLPAVLQLNPEAEAFTAYRTVSVLRTQYLAVELAVRTILGQVGADREVLEELHRRGARERIDLPDQLVKRIAYVFDND
jgi:hypothetical protein